MQRVFVALLYAVCAISGVAVYAFVSPMHEFGVRLMYAMVLSTLLVSVLVGLAKNVSHLVTNAVLAFSLGLSASLAVAGFGCSVLSLFKLDYARCMEPLTRGAQVLRIWMLSHGQDIYPPLGQKTQLLNIYPPVYFCLAALVNLVVASPYTSGVIVNAMGVTAIIFLLFKWVRHEKASILISCIVVAAFFGNSLLTFILKWVKPDLLGLSVALFGAYLFFCAKSRKLNVVAAGMLLALIFFVKQQMVIVPIGCVTYCLVRPSYFKRCFLMGLAFLASSAVFLVIVMYFTDGRFLGHTLLYPMAMTGVPTLSSWSFAVSRCSKFALDNAGLLAVLLFALVLDIRNRRIHPLTWMSLVSAGFLALFYKHWGADETYPWLFLAFSNMRAGCFLAEIENESRSRRLVVVSLVAFLFASAQAPMEIVSLGKNPRDYYAAVDGIDEMIRGRGFEKILMTAESSPSALGRKWLDKVSFFDAIDLNQYERTGLFKFYDSQMAADIVDKKYDAVLSGGPYVSEAFTWYVLDSYRKDGQSGYSSLYVRRPGRVVLYLHPTDEVVQRDGLSLRLVEKEGVYSTPGFGAFSFTQHDGYSKSYVTFELQSDRDMHSLSVAFAGLAVRPGQENRLEVQTSEDGTNFSTVYTYVGEKGDMDKGFFGGRREAQFPVRGRKIWIRYLLVGSAQLWYSNNYPLCFNVE